MDLATFWDCQQRAFAHFGGVPAAIVYDRARTVIKRHVAPREAVPLHPEAAAFAAHYGFTIDPLAAYRPTGKGRVERQVLIVRDHVLAGRSFGSVADRHLRRVGKDCLISFEATMNSVPARRVRARQRVELRVAGDTIAIHALTAETSHAAAEATLLAVHPQAARRGSWVIHDTHWDGLPTGGAEPPSSSNRL
jgi:hypothetical protein